MKIFIDQFLFFTFIVATLFMGSMIVGFASVRIYITALLLIWLFVNGMKLKVTTEMKLYFAFILLYLINLFLNGEIYQMDFGKYFIGRYFVCLSAIYITFTVLNQAEIINRTIGLLLFIGIINAVVSYLQFIGNETAQTIPMIFKPNGAEIRDSETITVTDSALGIGVGGMFGNIVRNGYFSAVFAIIGGLAASRVTNIIKKIILIFVALMLIYTVFLTQQRLVLVLVLIFYFYYLNRNGKYLFAKSIIFVVSLSYINFSQIIPDTENLGRYNDMNDEGRIEIYSGAISFILENLFFGGQIKFANEMIASGMSVPSAHNLFLNAFIYGGLSGGIVVIWLFLRMIFHSGRILFLKSHKGKAGVFFAATLLIYLANSLTHNASLVTGDEHIWLLYGLLLKSEEYNVV